MIRLLPVWLAIAALCLAPFAAQAQIFTGMEPAQPLVIPRVNALPASGPAPLPKAPDPIAEDQAPVTQPSVKLLRYLPNTLEGFRVNGETGHLQWPVYLTLAQAEAPLRFRLAYLSAISVLEDTSSITLKVNNHIVGTIAIHAPQALKTVDFVIPQALAVAGYNAISLSIQQRHRVDCSLAATYELWTSIDPTRTGLLVDGTPSIADVRDIPSLLPNADGTLPIRIVLASKANAGQVERLIKATQMIAIAGQFQQPAVDFGPFAEDPHGLNLVLGTREALAKLPQIGDAAGLSGPSLNVRMLAGSKRPTLVISGSSDAEVDDALEQLGTLRFQNGSEAGLRAAATYPGLKTLGDTHLHLKDLNIASEEFSGRLFKRSFNLILPADFMSADYARGTFDLSGGYSAGLLRNARIRIDVNGRNAGQVELPKQSGDAFRHNQMFLPLGLMKPGLNRVDLFAELPSPEDAACDSIRPAAQDKRFLLLDTSELSLPALARAERLPDLALMTSGGLPYSADHSTLFVPKPDHDTMAAALSLVARAAVSAGRIIPFDFTVTRPLASIGSLLVVAPARTLDPALMRDAGLDSKAVETAWRDRASSSTNTVSPQNRWWSISAEGPASCRLPQSSVLNKGETKTVATNATDDKLSSKAKDDEDDLFEHWNAALNGGSSWRDDLALASLRLRDWTDRAKSRIAWLLHDRSRDRVISSQTSLILAQGTRSAQPGTIVTIVTGPDSSTLKSAVSCLTDPRIWTQVHGRLSMLDASNAAVISVDAERLHYAMSQSLSIKNSRLVLAGWLSLNPLAFVVIALLTALCLSGTTLLFVRGIGRKGPK